MDVLEALEGDVKLVGHTSSIVPRPERVCESGHDCSRPRASCEVSPISASPVCVLYRDRAVEMGVVGQMLNVAIPYSLADQEAGAVVPFTQPQNPCNPRFLIVMDAVNVNVNGTGRQRWYS